MQPLTELDLVPDVDRQILMSGTVYGTLLNFREELASLGDELNHSPYQRPPQAPILYIKPANTRNAHGSAIPLPRDVEELQVGATLGIIIGRSTTRVSEQAACEFIQGYTVVNDVSVVHGSYFRPATVEKSRDGFCPMGPRIVQRDSVLSPDNLRIEVKVNGEVRQVNSTANLIRPIARLIADITSFMTLSAGDILLVGIPEKPPCVRSGDVIDITIEGIGTLTNKVVPESDLDGRDAS